MIGRGDQRVRHGTGYLVLALVAGSVAACGFAGAGVPARAPAGLREDRVTVGAYGEVVAMAASQRMIFAASPAGLAAFDRVAQRWLPPLTEADGYPAGRITAIAGDPDSEAVWIAALGEVLFYRPAIDQLIRTVVGGRTDRILFDRDDPTVGAYVGAGDRWTRVSPGGFAVPISINDLPPQGRRIASPSLESLSEEVPALRSFSDLLTRDDALRSWRPSSAAQVAGMSEVWLGTLGGGIYLADPLFNRARHMTFGLFEPGVSALALASDGVWAAALGADPRGTGGVTFASVDLQSWRWLRGPADGSMASLPAYDMLVRDGIVWIATERGVARRDPRPTGRERAPEWSWTTNRDARRAYALAVQGGSVWAGTDAGLVLVGAITRDGGTAPDLDATSAGSRGSPGGMGRVRALLASGDTLWVGSAAGLRIVRVAGGATTAAPSLNVPSWMRQPIVALARGDSVVLVATDDRIGMIDLGTGAVTSLPGNPDLARLGHLTTLALDARTIWIGGERGAVVIDRATGLLRSTNVPGTPSEPVFDIALQPDFAWLATPSGLVRIRRLPDGGVR